jgi:hypothetical protein
MLIGLLWSGSLLWQNTPLPTPPSGGFGVWYETQREARGRRRRLRHEDDALLSATEDLAEPLIEALPEAQQNNALEKLDALVAKYRPNLEADFSALAAQQDAEIARAAQLIVAKWRKDYIRRQDEEIMFLLMH